MRSIERSGVQRLVFHEIRGAEKRSSLKQGFRARWRIIDGNERILGATTY